MISYRSRSPETASRLQLFVNPMDKILFNIRKKSTLYRLVRRRVCKKSLSRRTRKPTLGVGESRPGCCGDTKKSHFFIHTGRTSRSPSTGLPSPATLIRDRGPCTAVYHPDSSTAYPCAPLDLPPIHTTTNIRKCGTGIIFSRSLDKNHFQEPKTTDDRRNLDTFLACAETDRNHSHSTLSFHHDFISFTLDDHD